MSTFTAQSGARHPFASRAAALKPAASLTRQGKLGVWLSLLAVLLVGYAACGKSVAYLGVPPLFVGEVVLACGIASALCGTQWHRLLYSPWVWLLGVFMVWGIWRTLPYVAEYRIDALRDAALFGYSAFALVILAHLVTRPKRLDALLWCYSKASLFIVLGGSACWALGRVFSESLPTLPWADVPIVAEKGGDLLVHLAGVMAFWLTYPDQFYSHRVRQLGLFIVAAAAAAAGSETRGGFVAFGSVFVLCLLVNPRNRSLHLLIVSGIVALVVMAATGLSMHLPASEREVSFDQVAENLLSVIGWNKPNGLDDTKLWRLEWWHKIEDYTLNGKYFWTGKGFGVNLATDDGFQVVEEGEGVQLRSPHSVHMTFLARAGVPGLLLWLIVLGTWAWNIALAYWRARTRNELRWAGLFFWLFAYFTAILVNGSFDVYLEGPLGGIWFWSVYGVGLAALWLFARNPELLHPAPVREVLP